MPGFVRGSVVLLLQRRGEDGDDVNNNNRFTHINILVSDNNSFLFDFTQVLSEMKKRWKHCWINKNGSWNPCMRGTSVSSPQHHPRLLVTEDQQTQVTKTTIVSYLISVYCDMKTYNIQSI